MEVKGFNGLGLVWNAVKYLFSCIFNKGGNYVLMEFPGPMSRDLYLMLVRQKEASQRKEMENE